MTPEMAFGKVLRELRNRHGYSQEKLALECDLDRTFISLLERGLRQPSLSTILQISIALGITGSEFMSLVENVLSTEKRA